MWQSLLWKRAWYSQANTVLWDNGTCAMEMDQVIWSWLKMSQICCCSGKTLVQVAKISLVLRTLLSPSCNWQCWTELCEQHFFSLLWFWGFFLWSYGCQYCKEYQLRRHFLEASLVPPGTKRSAGKLKESWLAPTCMVLLTCTEGVSRTPVELWCRNLSETLLYLEFLTGSVEEYSSTFQLKWGWLSPEAGNKFCHCSAVTEPTGTDARRGAVSLYTVPNNQEQVCRLLSVMSTFPISPCGYGM